MIIKYYILRELAYGHARRVTQVEKYIFRGSFTAGSAAVLVATSSTDNNLNSPNVPKLSRDGHLDDTTYTPIDNYGREGRILFC